MEMCLVVFCKTKDSPEKSGGIPVDLLGGSVAGLIEFMLWCNFLDRFWDECPDTQLGCPDTIID